MIAFNPNLTTFTHSAAELCHCFRGNQGMEKKKGSSERRGQKPRLYTVVLGNHRMVEVGRYFWMSSGSFKHRESASKVISEYLCIPDSVLHAYI